MKKKRLVILVSLLVLTVVLAITSSYALFNMNITKNKIFKVAVGNLELKITDTESEDKIIINDMVPMKEETALETTPYTFTLTNTGSLPATYTIYLDDITVSNLPQGITGRLDDSVVRANLYNKETGKKYTFSLANNRILEAGVLNPDDSIEYELRIWLDYEADNSSQNKYYAGRIRVDGVQGYGIKTLGSLILEQNKVVTSEPTLTTTSQEANEKGLYKKSVTNGFGGQDGDTYYFRGNVENNYVSFAGFTWRIVRINEDGTVRLIMQDGINNNQTYKFNDDASTVEYMYYSNSNAKTVLDNWYQENIVSRGYGEKVATGNYFCEQVKTTSSNYTYGLATPIMYTTYTPNFICTTDGNGYGLLNTNVGLVSYDELKFAGSSFDRASNYYLNNGSATWTTSTLGIKEGSSYSWNARPDGSIRTLITTNVSRIRPVINLKSDVLVTGNGKQNDPYVVIMDENYRVANTVDLAIAQFDKNDLKDVVMCDQTGDIYSNCKIYNTIDAAIADRDTGTIILTKDITRTSTITIAADKNIILDLNGKKIERSTSGNLITNKGNLVINDTIGTSKCISGGQVLNNSGTGTLVINGGYYERTLGTGTTIYNDDVGSGDIIINTAAVYNTSTGPCIQNKLSTSTTPGNIYINGGIYISNGNNSAITNYGPTKLNITQTDKPIYITSLAQAWKPAILNNSTGTINITANQANACTSNASDTTSGLCVYAEGNVNATDNDRNGAVQNKSSGVININGGTYYGGAQGMNNNYSSEPYGIINVRNARIISDRGIINTYGGEINICNSVFETTRYNIYNNSTGTINYSNVTFSNGTTTPGSGEIYNPSGTINAVATCPITE